MKTSSNTPIGSPRGTTRAFTLVEVMMAVAITSLMLLAMICSQIYGLRVAALATNRISTVSDGRQTMDQIRDAVRSGQTIYIGSCSPTNPASFILATNAQQGAAMQVFSTTNSSGPPYIIYYLDNSNAGTNYIKSYTVSSNGTAVTQTLAAYVTNTVIFYAEDYLGNVLTNNVNNRVIDVLFQFNQYGFAAGSGSFNSSYQLQTRTTQRTLNSN